MDETGKIREGIEGVVLALEVAIRDVVDQQHNAFWTTDPNERFWASALEDLRGAVRYCKSAASHIDMMRGSHEGAA